MVFADEVIQFIQQLKFPAGIPNGIEVMNPFGDADTMKICEQFYKKYYTDKENRWMIIGINPGRFGAGVTGIPFTDPIRLQKDCGIGNNWPIKQELSSLYVYDMIAAFGGTTVFYKNFYITAVSPLGFTRDGKNLNYYDNKILQERIKPFVIDCFRKQFDFGIHRNRAFCLGEGKNFQYLSKLNAEEHLFETIVPLPHPRFIMQYRLKKKQAYIQDYIRQLKTAIV